MSLDMATNRMILCFFLSIVLKHALVVLGMPFSFVDKLEEVTLEARLASVRNDASKVPDDSSSAFKTCSLAVDGNSKNDFSMTVLKGKYNFVHLKLNFVNFTVKEGKYVIDYKSWIWTYKGENGGYQYLYLPLSFGYLSFGLLWAYTLVDPITVEIQSNGTCDNLTSGGDADVKIGEALGDMTEHIASVTDAYSRSYWCYTKRLNLWGALWYICENVVCPYQTYEYRCCKFIVDPLTNSRRVECSYKHYYLAAVWWLLPILLGNILWIYFPILLTFISCKISSVSGLRLKRNTEMEDVSANDFDNGQAEECVCLSKDSFPVTFLETMSQPFLICNFRGGLCSRLLRSTIILLPVTILTIELLIHNSFGGSRIKAYVEKGALLGFSSLLAGFKSANKYFLVIFGGPYIALSLYFICGSILIQLPKDFETFLEKGLSSFNGLGSSPLTLSLETKSRIAGLKYNDKNGFRKVHLTFLSNLLLLLNIKFWKDTMRVLINRWKHIVYPCITMTKYPCVNLFVSRFLIVPYIICCILEIVAVFLFFAFPVFSCLFILIKSYVSFITDIFQFQSKYVKWVSYLIIPLVVLALCFTWYIFCTIFFQNIWFLTNVVMFTYSGVIAYPKISYGYLILFLMSVYYIADIFNKFGKRYQDLLNVSIKACRKVAKQLDTERCDDILCYKGISRHLWEVIIERHRPRRVLVASTLLQLTIVISVLSISVDLLDRFNKFQELSLITHVFTVLAICTLPKIVKSLYIDKLCSQRKRNLVAKIQETIFEYLNEVYEEELPIYDLNNPTGYERIPD